MEKNLSIALITFFALGALTASAQANEMIVCPQLAKVCPDGSSVGPTGPNCEFICGGPTATTPKPPVLAPTIPGLPLMMGGGAPGVRSDIKPTNTSARPIALPPMGVSAGQNATGTYMINREQMERRAMELRASTTAARANIKDAAEKRRLEIARKQTELISKRLEAAIVRVQKLSDRVAERLNKLEADGVNVTVSRDYISQAKTKLEEARTKAAAVKLAIETAFASTTPKEAMKGVQDSLKDATKTIHEAQRSVAGAISSAKPGLNRARATTTTSTTVVPVSTSTNATTTQ